MSSEILLTSGYVMMHCKTQFLIQFTSVVPTHMSLENLALLVRNYSCITLRLTVLYIIRRKAKISSPMQTINTFLNSKLAAKLPAMIPPTMAPTRVVFEYKAVALPTEFGRRSWKYPIPIPLIIDTPIALSN